MCIWNCWKKCNVLDVMIFSLRYEYVRSMHCAAVRQHSNNSNNKIVHNSIEHFLCNLSDFFSDDVLSCLWIVFTNSVFQVPPPKIVWRVEILGIGWPGVIGLTWNESVPWDVMPEVFLGHPVYGKWNNHKQ